MLPKVTLTALLVLLLTCVACHGTRGNGEVARVPDWLDSDGVVKSDQVTEEDFPYLRRWLDKNGKPAREYITHLFEHRQVVILGEEHNVREHKEFLIDLIPTLYREAGVRCIGWEFTRSGQNKRLQKLIDSPDYDEEEVLRLARDAVTPDWNSKEHWEVIRAVWEFNKSLTPGSEGLRVIGLVPDIDVPGLVVALRTKPLHSPDYRNSAEFQKLLKVISSYDEGMAHEVEKEILLKGQKGLLLVGTGHDWTDYRYPPNPSNFGIAYTPMGNLLKQRHGNKVFQVRLQSSSDPSFIDDVVARSDHESVGFDMRSSPFADIAVPVGKGEPDVPWWRLANGYIHLGPREGFHPNTVIDDFIDEETFRKYQRYYEISFGRDFASVDELNEYMQAHRWPHPR